MFLQQVNNEIDYISTRLNKEVILHLNSIEGKFH